MQPAGHRLAAGRSMNRTGTGPAPAPITHHRVHRVHRALVLSEWYTHYSGCLQCVFFVCRFVGDGSGGEGSHAGTGVKSGRSR